ncbi:MAG: hypothetical protein J7M14_01775 [Planctomycetes bacterium]|nr:hypothetical protein [Planctomycetota bacterium]
MGSDLPPTDRPAKGSPAVAAHPRTLPAAQWYMPVVLTVLLWMSIVFAAEGFKPFVYAAF